MSSNSHGFTNEIYMSNYLNNKKFCELNSNFQNFISFVFNRHISSDEIISSDILKKIESKNPKPDIWIKIGNEIKYISIKEGSGNSVHQEPLNDFCDFLKQIKISNDNINNLRFYHYGDDTLEGNGKTRFSTAEKKSKYSDKIFSVNKELNLPKNLIKILNRILFVGVFQKPIIVDAIYHGSIEDGVYANREEIINYLITTTNINEMTGIQFSQLTYQPWTRDQFRSVVHPERRYIMQVKWGSMTNCIKLIAKGRKNNGNK